MTSAGGVKPTVLETKFVASPQQVSCAIADEAVLLSFRDGEYYGLNEVAATIWALIQRPRSVRELCDDLLEQYDDVDEAECEHSVVQLLEEMVSLELVTIIAEAQG